jgi:prepilin signal peptidase PulO-like enzyme (type II secretory pathway)
VILALHLALWTAIFALAAWGGVLAAEILCAGRAPADDGPRPVRVAPQLFPLAGAALGVAFVLHGDAPGRLALLALAVLALAGCTAADLACGMLPDLLTLGPLAFALGTAALARDWHPAFGAGFVALPFALLALFSRGRGMGWGDVKLAALGGALLGAGDAAIAVTLAALAAYLTAYRRRRLREPTAFGPYLAIAFAALLAAGARV